MAFIIKSSSYTPAPEGLHNAVCVDVVDMGVVETRFGKKAQVRLVWEVDATMDDGRRFTVSKRYAPSLHEKSALHKDLKAWRGRAFTAEELSGFDLESVLGAPCKLLVAHVEREGTVYANLTAIIKADRESKLLPSGTFVRTKDRPQDEQRGGSGGNGHGFTPPPGEDAGEECPF